MLPKVESITFLSTEKNQPETTFVWKKLSKTEKRALTESIINGVMNKEVLRIKLNQKPVDITFSSKGDLVVTEVTS